MALPAAEELIRLLGLKPHPEGGFYKESYRAAEAVSQQALPARYSGPRRFSTAIYFLLPEGAKSRLHRVKSDELWHFYLGGPMTVAEIAPDGTVRRTVMGQDVKAGQVLQHAVAAGAWFGAWPEAGGGYALVGCTVAPGFEFADFELGKRAELLKAFPQAADVIGRLTD